MRRVAVVGLGAMGAPMAGALSAAGFELALFDVAADRTREVAADLGATALGSPAEAAQDADVAVLMVADAAQAREALLGEAGAAAALPGDAPVVVMSTIGPEAVLALEPELGRPLLDAPVSGGVARARTGDLLVMAGGPTALLERVRPVLDAMGAEVVHCGERPGDGQRVKLVNQLLCGVHIAAAAEALAYAGRLGLDPRTVHATVAGGAAASFMLEDRGRRMLDRAFDDPRSALDIFVKDLGLVTDAGVAHGARTPLADAARALFVDGQERGLGREDDSGVIRVLEE